MTRTNNVQKMRYAMTELVRRQERFRAAAARVRDAKPAGTDDAFSVWETFNSLVRVKRFSSELARLIRHADGAERAVEGMRQAFCLNPETSPWQRTPCELIGRFCHAYAEENWGRQGGGLENLNLSDIVAQLAASQVPYEQKSREGLLLTLRIRFGFGRTGHADTFRAHLLRMSHVALWSKHVRFEVGSDLEGVLGKENLPGEILEREDGSKFQPVVEWAFVDLTANRESKVSSQTGGDGSINPLPAEELLAALWLHPEIMGLIGDALPNVFVGGYLFHTDGDGCEAINVPRLYRNVIKDQAKIIFDFGHKYEQHTDHSVPVLV